MLMDNRHRKTNDDCENAVNHNHARLFMYITLYARCFCKHSRYLFERGIYFRRIKRVYNADVFRACNSKRRRRGKERECAGMRTKYGDRFEHSSASRRGMTSRDAIQLYIPRKKLNQNTKRASVFTIYN